MRSALISQRVLYGLTPLPCYGISKCVTRARETTQPPSDKKLDSMLKEIERRTVAALKKQNGTCKLSFLSTADPHLRTLALAWAIDTGRTKGRRFMQNAVCEANTKHRYVLDSTVPTEKVLMLAPES